MSTNKFFLCPKIQYLCLLAEVLEDLTNVVNVKCGCFGKHQGKETLNQVFDLGVNFLFECVLGSTDFRVKYWESRKFLGLKTGTWKQQSGNVVFSRLLEYSVDLGALGKPFNNENQVFQLKLLFSLSMFFINKSCLTSNTLIDVKTFLKKLNGVVHMPIKLIGCK